MTTSPRTQLELDVDVDVDVVVDVVGVAFCINRKLLSAW
jgi:hypothetical protein